MFVIIFFIQKSKITSYEDDLTVENDRCEAFFGIFRKRGNITYSKPTIKFLSLICMGALKYIKIHNFKLVKFIYRSLSVSHSFLPFYLSRGIVFFIAKFYVFHDMLWVLHLATARRLTFVRHSLSPEVLWQLLWRDLFVQIDM